MLKKKLGKVVALLLIVAVITCCLTACTTGLRGTYTSDGLIKQSFTFKEDNIIVISAFGINAEGTYKIEDDKIIITYSLFNLSYDLEKSFAKKGDTITIDGTDFVKEK